MAESIGIPSSQGALLVGYFALAQTVGKILFGKLGDSSRISRLTLAQISLLVIAVAACLCPLARSHMALLTYSLVSGLFDGCLCVMIGLVTHDIVGRGMMAKAVGTLYGIVAIPMAIGPPMAGTYPFCSSLTWLLGAEGGGGRGVGERRICNGAKTLTSEASQAGD